MDVEFSKHAIERMTERNITGAEIRAVLDGYTDAEQYGNGFRLTGMANGRKIIVGVNNIDDKIIIATVFEKEIYGRHH